MKWYPFDPKKGYRQKRPPIRKHVLLILKPLNRSMPCRVVVGYRKDAGGDKSCPYFVRPGLDFPDDYKITTPYDPFYTDVLMWCDGLAEDFKWPYEETRGIRDA